MQSIYKRYTILNCELSLTVSINVTKLVQLWMRGIKVDDKVCSGCMQSMTTMILIEIYLIKNTINAINVKILFLSTMKSNIFKFCSLDTDDVKHYSANYCTFNFGELFVFKFIIL